MSESRELLVIIAQLQHSIERGENASILLEEVKRLQAIAEGEMIVTQFDIQQPMMEKPLELYSEKPQSPFQEYMPVGNPQYTLRVRAGKNTYIVSGDTPITIE